MNPDNQASGQALAGGQLPAGQILVVEDDPDLREALCHTLNFAGYATTAVADGHQALDAVDRERNLGMVLSDVRMPNMDGQTLLQRLNERKPHLPVLMMTAYATIDAAVNAMRSGAVDYLQKPVERSALLNQVAKHLREPADLDGACDGFVAADERTRAVLRLAQRVAGTEATVMINGESGTGKEVLARYIHAASARKAEPFVAINCAAIPASMLEATLFGHEKGAFTGAHKSVPGKFEQANGGTLLLDEVTEMDFDLQAKLLRVLQEREIERIGATRTIDLDVRVIATTNRDLPLEVSAGRFREDLYYRLNVFPVALPALRERPGDILPLARQFLAQMSLNGRAPRHLHFSDAASRALEAHDWPGNVRELGNVVQRATVLSDGDQIDVDHLQLSPSRTGWSGTSPVTSSRSNETPARIEEPVKDIKAHEQDLILRSLTECGGSRKATAERLGMSARTLRYKLARMRESGVIIPSSNPSRGN